MSETTNPLLSVVVPIYNVGTYLAPCLESLLSASLTDLEIICVDDGSTDGSGELADQFAGRDPRIRVLHVENGGLGKARNIGLDVASGRYLAFVDSDDRVPARAYEQLCGTLEATGSDLSAGRVRRFTDTRSWQSGLHAQAIPRPVRATHIRKMPSLAYDTTAWNKVFRRSFWDEHALRFPEGVLYEDMPVTIPAHVLAGSVDLLTSSVYEWRERGDGSMSITQRRAELTNLKDRVTALEFVSDFLAGHDLPNVSRVHDRKVMTLDLPLYLWVLDVADDAYRAFFAQHVSTYLEHVDPGTIASLPVWERVAYELLRRGRVEETVQLVRDRAAAKEEFQVRRKGTRLLADLPFLGDPQVGLPDAVYTVTNKLPVMSAVDGVRIDDSAVEVSGFALIDKVALQHPWSAIRYLRLKPTGRGRTLHVPLRPLPSPEATATYGTPDAGYDYAGYRARIPLRRLRSAAGGRDYYTIQLKIVTPVARRGVTLRRGGQGNGRTPSAIHIREDGTYISAYTTLPGEVRIAVRTDYALIDKAWFEDDAATLACELRLRKRPPAGAVLTWRCDDDGVPPVEAPLEFDAADPLRATVRTDLREHRLGGDDGGQRVWRAGIAIPGDQEMTTVVVAAPGWDPVRSDRVMSGRAFATRVGAGGRLVLAVHRPRATVTSACWQSGKLVLDLKVPADVAADQISVVLVRSVGGNVLEPIRSAGDGGQLRAEFEILRADEQWSVPPGTWSLRVEHGDVLSGDTLPVDVDERRILDREAGSDQPTAVLRTGQQRLSVVVRANRVSERGPFHQHRLVTGPYAAARQDPLRDTVLFQSWGGKQFSDSPRALYEEMQRQGRDEPVLWVRRDTSVDLPAGTPSVLYGSREYFAALATARHVIANDAMPTFYAKRSGSNYLQTWHGTPLKRIGFDIENAQFGNRNYLQEFAVEVTKWDQLISPNPFSTEIFRRAFDYPGEILETGYPRNDVFYAPDAEERRHRVRAALGLRPDQRVILWAPTWREDQRDGKGRYTLPLPFDLSTWDRILRPEDRLLFRGHQLIQQTVSGMLRGLRQVQNVTLYPDIQDLYLAADVLITDYSSVMFDFANTRRPMIFYAWDLEHYRDHLRGFYFDFESTVPGPVVTDLEELRELLAVPTLGGTHADAYERFVERFCGLEDGGASARALHAILDR